MNAISNDDARWQAVLGRDADARFFYAVATTGVYCRPACPARRPHRANVAFYETPDAAEAAGFQPCKRCRPRDMPATERRAQIAQTACRLIEEAQTPPTLAALAAALGLSPYHFHRIFKKATGLTPKAYAAAHRRQAMQSALVRGGRVTDAIYEAGYGSSSRFYEAGERTLGMTARQYRGGGRDLRIRFALAGCSLGTLLVAATDKGVCAIFLGDDAALLLGELRARFPKAALVGGDAAFATDVARVVDFIEAPQSAFAMPLDIAGTAFQQRVWQALSAIPAGQTRSYREVAVAIGQPKAVRAVASACAANPVAVAIPCHRVLRGDGSLGGYRWGLQRKAALLKKERAT